MASQASSGAAADSAPGADSSASADSDAAAGPRPLIFYVSYDGMGEPLGRSQVLAYLFRLAPDYDIRLFSFEKSDADRAELAAELCSRGIDWHPLSYHKRPPVLSTAIDAALGCAALRAASRHRRPDIVHVRSYVPALIALWARRWTGGELLFDMRGFWVDERVEGGIWPTNRLRFRLLYRVGKWCERRFFRRASAVVTLTHASVPRVRALLAKAGRVDSGVREGSGERQVVVIPTCVDLERFELTEPRTDGPRLTWSGSIGTWYRFDLVAPLARVLEMPLQVITRETELAEEILGGMPATVQTLPQQQMPTVLRSGDVGVSLCVSSASKVASAPTRFAEYLAAGMPVVVNPGVGDVVEITEQHRVGVVLRGYDDAALRDAAERIRGLLAEPDLPQRCRAVAAELFDVNGGARRYSELYSRLIRTRVEPV